MKIMNVNALKNLPLVDLAEVIAKAAHAGQFRRDGITPYIVHPKAVADSLENVHYKAVAWLHDVLEDTTVSKYDLMVYGVPADVIEAIEILTKKKNQPYGEYLKGVKENAMAKAVKIADMKANLADSPTKNQILKYTQGLSFLGDEK